MQRKAIVQVLMNRLGNNPYIRLIYESDYNNAKTSIDKHKAKAALVEVAETGPYNIRYCLALCKELRESKPDCKLILMCPEDDEGSVKQVVNAKGKKLIDDFVFYDVTMDYLTSKLLSI